MPANLYKHQPLNLYTAMSDDEMVTASSESDDQHGDRSADWKPGTSARTKGSARKRPKSGKKAGKGKGKKPARKKVSAVNNPPAAGGAPASPATTGVNIGNAAPVPPAKSGKALMKADPASPGAALGKAVMNSPAGGSTSQAATQPEIFVINDDDQCVVCKQREKFKPHDTCCAPCKNSGGQQHDPWCDHNQQQIEQYNASVGAWRAQVQKGPPLLKPGQSSQQPVKVKLEGERPFYAELERCMLARKTMYRGAPDQSGMIVYAQDKRLLTESVYNLLERINIEKQWTVPLFGLSCLAQTEVSALKELIEQGNATHGTSYGSACMIQWPFIQALLGGGEVNAKSVLLAFKLPGDKVDRTMFPGVSSDKLPMAVANVFGRGIYFSLNLDKALRYCRGPLLNLKFAEIPGGFQPEHFLLVSPQMWRNSDGQQDKLNVFLQMLEEHERKNNVPMNKRVLFVVCRLVMCGDESTGYVDEHDQLICRYPELISGLHSTRLRNAANAAPALCAGRTAPLIVFQDPFSPQHRTSVVMVGGWLVTQEKYEEMTEAQVRQLKANPPGNFTKNIVWNLTDDDSDAEQGGASSSKQTRRGASPEEVD